MPRTPSADNQPRTFARALPQLVSKAEAQRIARTSGLSWAGCEAIVNSLPTIRDGKRDKISLRALETAIAETTSIVPLGTVRGLSERQLARLSG